MDAFVERVVAGFWSWGLVALLVVISPGLAMWPLAHPDDRDYVIANDLDADQRVAIIKTMLLLALPMALCYLGFHLVRLRRGGRPSLGDSARRLNRFAFVIMVAPLLAVLAHRGIEEKHEFLTLVVIGVCTGILGVFTHRVLGLRTPKSVPELIRWRWLPPLCAMGLAVFYALYASHLALLDHRNLGTHVYDLGIYDNVFWRTVNGDFLGCSYCKTGKHVSAHFDPIIAVFSPLYMLSPRAETLLVLQSVWLATAAAPLYLLATRRLGNPWFGVLLVALYVLYPALHGVNLFDFHSLTMVVPSLTWAIYFIDVGARWRYWLVLVLMLLTREDMSLLACFVGAYAVLQRRPWTGVATVVVALSYLAFVKLEMMNDSGLMMAGGKDSMSYVFFYEDMIPHESEGLKGLIISLVTNPGFVLKVLLMEQKVFFALALLGPLLFLPFIAGRKTVIMVYGLIFLGLASRRHVYSLHFQYSSVLFPVLLASLPDAIARASEARVVRALGISSRRLSWTLMWTCLLATALTSIKFGAFVPNDSFKAGWNSIVRNPKQEHRDRYEKVKELAASIPPDAPVSSTSGLGPHISNRRDVYKWPAYREADYLLLHSSKFDKKDKRRLERLVKRGEYRRIDGGLGIELFEKVPEEERKAIQKADRDARGKRKRSAEEIEQERLDDEDLEADIRRRPDELDGDRSEGGE
ncbi:DUF2079 domain-containing protein [Paraliomyxa miuraensis]|uniref:DUF2079 domain-containing protein n=1 Tax=Paraliomyxa miuraensis TaxID=376150 RepID=UPI00225C15FF|nr:DUF2079 domain-containing protein [Paraliomyxa miuraensis]MCX4244485.1 DUF2079 domain-containing protein [Paraliomyxa miuraensis]